jgi:hypothetical protein
MFNVVLDSALRGAPLVQEMKAVRVVRSHAATGTAGDVIDVQGRHRSWEKSR